MKPQSNRRGRTPALKDFKAEIARLYRKGHSSSEISKKLGISRPTVYRWRNYSPDTEEASIGRKRRKQGTHLSKEKEAEVIQRALEHQQNHVGHLNVNALSNALGVSYGIVRRILKRHQMLLSPEKKKALGEKVMTSVPTQKMIAQISGYSQPMVSRALKNDLSVSDAIRQEIQGIAAKIGYRANPQLSSLARTRWRGQKLHLKFVYLLAQRKNIRANPDDQSLFKALSSEADKKGYLLESLNLLDYPSAERLAQVLYHRGVQGVVFGFSLHPHDIDFLFKNKEGLWADFSLIGTHNFNCRFLNYVIFQQIELALHNGFSRAKDKGYRRIGYVCLPEVKQAGSTNVWHSGSILDLIKRIQTVSSAPHNRIPSLLLEKVNKTYEQQTIDDYIAEYEPDLILSNSDRGYEIIKSLKIRKQPAYISLDRDDDENGEVSGLILSDWSDYANKIFSILSEQIYQNQFGVPVAPQVHSIGYKQWIDGKSFSRKKRVGSKLEWIVPPASTTVRAENKKTKCLDLSKVVNRNRMIVGQWFGDGTLPLPRKPLKKAGLHFQPIGDLEENILIMRSALHQGLPEQKVYPERVSIPINRKFEACNFLHTGGFIAELDPFAVYIFHYADGTQCEIPLFGVSPSFSTTYPSADWNYYYAASELLAYRYAPKENIGDWHAYYTLGVNQLPAHVQAIVVNDDTSGFYCYLYALRWANPTPDKEVVSLEVVSSVESRSTLAVLAVTLELF